MHNCLYLGAYFRYWALYSLLESPLETLSNGTSFMSFDPVLTELLLLYIKDASYMPAVIVIMARYSKELSNRL